MTAAPLERARPQLAVAVALVAVLGFSAIDYVTGVEYRVYPVYMLPVAVAAWWAGHSGAALVSLVAGSAWVVSNYLAGMRPTHVAVWVFNATTQTAVFLTMGFIVAGLRRSLLTNRALSRHDALTGLLNGRAFQDDAPRLVELARRHGRPLTLAYLDLDNFKQVNDREGHARGDQVLVAAAGVLRAETRVGDLAARLGGDEFALLLPETDRAGAHAMLERVRVRLAQVLAPHAVTASIGGLVCAPVRDDLDTLVRRADAFMYTAKRAGKDRVHLDGDAPSS